MGYAHFPQEDGTDGIHLKTHFIGEGSGYRVKLRCRLAAGGDSARARRLCPQFDRFIYRLPGISTEYADYLRSKELFDAYCAEIPDYMGRKTERGEIYRGRVSAVPQEHTQTTFLADRAIDWLRNHKADKPFFLWVSFIDPHAPFTGDTRWAARYKESKMPLGPLAPPRMPDNAWGQYLRAWMKGTGTDILSPERAREAERHYYGATSLIDQKIGDISKAVQDLGWSDNTWFFYTSDHGEMMGDHQLMFKNVFYKSSVLVPNIIQPACELFDLEKDPDELNNLVEEPGYAGIRKELHKDYVLPFLEKKA